MPLLGSAAMLLSFDVAEEAIAEHDHWHTHEHLPERLSIPGFLRGTRWVAVAGQPRYFVLYEVAQLATLSSDAYLERLNHPSEWTTKIMPHYRGMSRGFCAVAGSFGLGLGSVAALLRFRPDADAAGALRQWLVAEVLPGLAARPGLSGAHLLEGSHAPAMTHEQRLRGTDAAVDWAVVVTGYEREAVEQTDLDTAQLEARGAVGAQRAVYRMADTLSQAEVGARPR